MNEQRKLLLEIGALVDRVTTLMEELESISDYAEDSVAFTPEGEVDLARVQNRIELISRHADTGIRLCRRTLDEFNS